MEKKKNPWMRWTAAVLFVLLCGVGAYWVVKVQDQYIYSPNLNETAEAYLRVDEDYREVTIEDGGKTYMGWIRPDRTARMTFARLLSEKENGSGQSSGHEDAGKSEVPSAEIPKKPLLICFGGNTQSSAGVMLRWKKREVWKYFDDYTVLMIDYPGYGRSDGRPGDKAILRMAEAAYEYGASLRNVDKSRIAVMGYSLGTGPATYVASRYPVCGLILIAPYDRLLNVYNQFVDIFHGPLALLARSNFNSIDYAREVAVSPLVIASTGDEIIPYEFSENLAAAFPLPAQLITVDGTEGGPDGVVTHTMLAVRKPTFKSMNEYLKACMAQTE